jgi:hypothetical protein
VRAGVLGVGVVQVVGGQTGQVEALLELEQIGLDRFSIAMPWSISSQKKLSLPKMSR